MPVKRYGHVMVEFFQPLDSGLLGTDYLVVHGGIDENAIISSDVYAYVGGACCASRFALARAFVHIRYNSTSAKWAQHSSFGGPALMEHSALVYDGQMCVSSPSCGFGPGTDVDCVLVCLQNDVRWHEHQPWPFRECLGLQLR